LAHDNRAFGYALSIEGGKRIGISERWTLTPQAQLVYSNVDFDSFTDPSGARVSLDSADSLAARFGLAVEHQNIWTNADGKVERASIHAIGNLHYEFLDGTQVDVAGTGFSSKNDDLWGELGLGGTYNWGADRYSLYGDVSASTSLASPGDSVALSGRAGLRVQW
jgi:outer membrane autotransporter protein